MNQNYDICYSTDASRLVGKVMKVVYPSRIEEVCETVRNAGDSDVIPRGFGISSVGGCVPNNSIVIDMRKLNNVTKFDRKARTVYADAGISIKELNEKLAQFSFEFPVFSGDKALVSVGGMIALNSAGDRSMRYGFVKDWVEEIEMVNGRGEIIKISKTDLMDVCGMEGITGIITKAKLKISPLIRRSASLFQTDELDEVLSIARRLKLDSEVIMLKFFSKKVSKMLGFPEKYNLIIEFNSDRGKIKGYKYREIMKKKDMDKFFLYSNGYYNSEDPKLFFDKIPEFTELLEKKEIPYTGDLGLGVIYPYFKDEKKEEEIISDFVKKTKVKFVKYGFGLKRKKLIESSEQKLIQRVKVRHDPFGKLNRGKLIDFDRRSVKMKLERDAMPILNQNIREELSAVSLVEELKSPSNEMEKFIEGIRIEEDVKEKLSRELDEKAEKIEKEMKDYEQTFSSELAEDKRKKIEDYASGISREIVRKETEQEKRESFDYGKIKDLMKDKFGFSGSIKSADDEKEDD